MPRDVASAPLERASVAEAAQETRAELDADGVLELMPSAPGVDFHLGAADPNRLEGFSIERGARAERRSQGSLAFWNVVAYRLEYSAGGSGKTIRLHLRPHGGEQLFSFRTQHGFLSSPADPKNQEFTVFVRVHGIFDPRRAALTLKIRGGLHTARDPELASCTMLTFAPLSSGAVSRFGKELVHPEYDYVTLAPKVPLALEDGRWLALKLVSFVDPSDARRVINRLYVDPEPFAATGRPRNDFRWLSEYVDVEGKSTGRYAKLVDWGGFQTSLRTDGVESLDFAIVSLREIRVPRTL